MRLGRFTTEQPSATPASLAGHQIAPGRVRRHRLWAGLRASEQTINAINAGLSDAVHLEQSIWPVAEWLLDNAYIVRRHVADVRATFQGFYNVLPVLEGTAHSGRPRIYELAFEFVSHTEAEVHVSDVTRFFSSYQQSVPLTTSELWAMPLMLRLALIEKISGLALAIDRRQHEHELADLWANRLLSARREADQLLFILAELAASSPTQRPTWPTDWSVSCKEKAIALDPIRAWLERKMGAPVTEVVQQEQLRRRRPGDHRQRHRQLAPPSSVDWRDVFEQVGSRAPDPERDPAGVYLDGLRDA